MVCPITKQDRHNCGNKRLFTPVLIFCVLPTLSGLGLLRVVYNHKDAVY
jgi:hypothetical protein